ncbi:MAG TPA: ankyrin repeat domain-containing protein [Candidatus Babeliaceae bacterium]|nr:ankyrin repeat domain-containing protein [Candidatus Babeliaceae bacterium]
MFSSKFLILLVWLVTPSIGIGQIPSQEKLDQELINKCESGTLQEIQDLIGKGANVNARSLLEGLTPLHKAAYFGNKEIVKLLISHKANVNATTGPDSNDTPLEQALIFYPGKNIDLPNLKIIIKMLLKAGTNPNIRSFFSMDMLLDTFVQDIKSFKAMKFSPLVRTLVLYGAKAGNAKTQKALPSLLSTSLYLFLFGEIKSIKEDLTAKPPISSQDIVKDNEDISILAYASGQAHVPLVNLLLSYPGYQYDTLTLEKALGIVSTKIKNFQLSQDEQFEQEYKLYKDIYEKLKLQLHASIQKQIDTFLYCVSKKDPALPQTVSQALVGKPMIAYMPKEIQGECFKYMLKSKSWSF